MDWALFIFDRVCEEMRGNNSFKRMSNALVNRRETIYFYYLIAQNDLEI